MKISAKVQILALALALLATILIFIACARTEQAETARLEEAARDAPAPTLRPPMPETTVPVIRQEPPIARTSAEVLYPPDGGRDSEGEPVPPRGPLPASGGVEDERELVLQDFMEFVNRETEIDDAELEMLACVIYTEAGGNTCSDLCRQMVGDVVLNRVEDPRFPGTMEEVLTQERQYVEWFWTGIQWPERADDPKEVEAVERAYDTARSLLEGNHSWIYGQGYIWEAEFPQGDDVIALDGIWFGR